MKRRPILAAALLVAVTLAAYLPASRAGFLWDDDRFLRDNPLIKSSEGLRLIWFSTRPTDYFPLTSTVLWFEWRIWGDHPLGYHVVNVLLHVAAALLLWRVLLRLKVPGAWLAGVLFAVHPLAVASAAWITELKNTLSLPLFLAALLLYLRFDENDSAIRDLRSAFCNRLYVSSLFLFLLALLAKTSVVMLPVILLLCAWWRRGRISRKDLLRSAPFFAFSLALGLATIWFQRHNGIQGEIVRPENLASRVAAAGWIAWFYLFKVFLPAGLCVIYPRWKVEGSSAAAFFPLLLLLGGVAVLWARRKGWGRAPLFAASYFLLMLLPVLGFVEMSFMTHSLVADHLQYAAMIAVIALAAAPASRCRFGTLAACGCVAVLAFLAWGRASLYANEKLLWQDNAAKNPSSWAAWSRLGNACSTAGLHEEAIRSFGRAIALRPGFAELYYNRAGEYAAADRFAEAVQDYQKAISLKRDYAAAWINLGSVYGRIGRFDDALTAFDRAIELNPGYREAYYNRAVLLYRTKRYGRALEDLRVFQEMGGRPNPQFLQELTEAAGSAGQ